jgi:hypothetical protein
VIDTLPAGGDTLTTRYRIAARGGWSVIPPEAAPRIGDRSRALRVLGERLNGDTYEVTVEGLVGAEYRLFVAGPGEWTSADAQKRGRALAGPRDYHIVMVTMPAAGANADGYVTQVLRFTTR